MVTSVLSAIIEAAMPKNVDAFVAVKTSAFGDTVDVLRIVVLKMLA